MENINQELAYEIINIKELDAVINFLKENFVGVEPITSSITKERKPTRSKILSYFAQKIIQENMSFIVKNKDMEFVAVCLNTLIDKNSPELDDFPDDVNRTKDIETFLDYVDQESRVFEKFPDVDKILLICMVAVDDRFKGKGIANTLFEKTRDLARKNGIKLMRVDCTSHFSARASARLGMECIYELKYSDYIVDGVQVFKPDPPHNEVKVYVQRLNE